MASQILTYWFASTLLGAAGLPLTTYLFRALPDRGYPFARALGLLLTGYFAWLLAMAKLSPFGAGTLTLCAAMVFGLGMLVQRRRAATEDKRPWHVRWIEAVGGWRLVVGYELIFLVALVFLAFLRAHDGNGFAPNPNPWNTERPMDFAFFNAIQRSQDFPPHDPWLSGFSINYYYLGYVLMAAVAQLSGLEAGVAYNLSLALIFALTAVGVAGVVVNLIRLSVDGGRRTVDGEQQSRIRLWLPWFAVVLSIVFVLVAGNQGTLLQQVTGVPQVLALGGQDMARAIANGLGSRAPLTLEQPFKGWGDKDLTTVVTPTTMIDDFALWWNSSRALYDRARDPADPTKYYAITEFPAFSFFLGDMHPHVMALPFGLLALALALATVARRSVPVWMQTWRGWIELALTGIVLGSLYAINSWDFPTYLLLFLLALLVLYLRLAREGRMPILWPQLAQHAMLAVTASFALFLPFYLTVKSLVGSKEPLIDLPVLGRLTSTIGFVTWSKTPLYTFVIIFGLFLLPLAAFIFGQGARLPRAVSTTEDEDQPAPVAARPPLAPNQLGIVARPTPPPALLTVLPWVTLFGLVLGVVAGFPLLFLLPMACYAFLLALRVESTGAAFALLAAGLGALVCFGTELVYIRDVFEGGASRMNTIFKFYYQVWLIWGLLAGYAVWWMVDGGRWTADGGRRRLMPTVRRLPFAIALALAAFFLLGALVYPWVNTFRTLREAPVVGLEGKTPRQRTPGGAAGIEWLRQNTRGDEIILEANGGPNESYDPSGQGIGGVSASTGLATVIGWPGHEYQWRGGDPEANAQIEPRRVDVETVYTTTDVSQARALLDKYQVNYVYIGEAERSRYGEDSLAKFAQFGEQVFAQDEVVIYRLNR